MILNNWVRHMAITADVIASDLFNRCRWQEGHKFNTDINAWPNWRFIVHGFRLDLYIKSSILFFFGVTMDFTIFNLVAIQKVTPKWDWYNHWKMLNRCYMMTILRQWIDSMVKSPCTLVNLNFTSAPSLPKTQKWLRTQIYIKSIF